MTNELIPELKTVIVEPCVMLPAGLDGIRMEPVGRPPTPFITIYVLLKSACANVNAEVTITGAELPALPAGPVAPVAPTLPVGPVTPVAPG